MFKRYIGWKKWNTYIKNKWEEGRNYMSINMYFQLLGLTLPPSPICLIPNQALNIILYFQVNFLFLLLCYLFTLIINIMLFLVFTSNVFWFFHKSFGATYLSRLIIQQFRCLTIVLGYLFSQLVLLITSLSPVPPSSKLIMYNCSSCLLIL